MCKEDKVIVQPQDIVVLGSTMLQLIAPQPASSHAISDVADGTELHPTRQLASLDHPHSLSDDASAERNPSSPVHGQGEPKVLPLLFPSQHPAQPPQSVGYPRSVQADAAMIAQPCENKEERVLRGSITMQFALPQRLGGRTCWFIVGIGISLLVVSTAVTIVLNSVLGLSALAYSGLSSVVAALIIPLLPALGISLLVNFMDRYEREPWFLRLAAFLWGAIIAIPPAFFIERYVDSTLQNLLRQDTGDVVQSVLQGLNAGVTEETIKGLGLLLLFLLLRDEFDNMTDGIIYGALIGAGFAMVENFVYFAQGSKNFLVFLIVERVILGWLGHSTYTACFGAALGYIRHTRVRWKQIVIPLLGYLVAVQLHGFFDFVDFQASAAVYASPGNADVALFSLVAIIGDYIPPFLAQMSLLYLLVRGLAHEAAVIREFLAEEVRNGVVLVYEYALLQNSFQRTKEERHVLWKSGFRQWLRVKALYQTEIGLAFRKWHVSMGEKPKLGYRQPEDAYRQRIGRWRREITGARRL